MKNVKKEIRLGLTKAVQDYLQKSKFEKTKKGDKIIESFAKKLATKIRDDIRKKSKAIQKQVPKKVKSKS